MDLTPYGFKKYREELPTGSNAEGAIIIWKKNDTKVSIFDYVQRDGFKATHRHHLLSAISAIREQVALFQNWSLGLNFIPNLRQAQMECLLKGVL